MTKRFRAALPALLACLLGGSSASAGVVPATDGNDDPHVFEAYLTADELDVTIDGTTVHALVYRDDPPAPFTAAPPGIPAPQIAVKVGDRVIVHFRSELEVGGTSIHWHGIELDNDSDGTGVTQNQLLKGEEHVYRFTVTRPGLFWYHPHMRPAHQDFSGMYGPLIIRDADAQSDREGTLEADGTIPSNVHTVVLSDINFNEAGDVGFQLGADFKNVNQMIMACAQALAGDPPAQDTTNCNIRPGETVLVNGEKPDPEAATPKIVVRSGEGLRLRLLNTAIARYFRLGLADNPDPNLYRIGGEGGFLEQVRLEGGVHGIWDTKYDEGQILMGPADRADVVIVPQGNDGDVIRVFGEAYGSNPNAQFSGDEFDLLYIEIQGAETEPFQIAAGDDVLGAGSIEDLTGLVIEDHLLPPPEGQPGSMQETIRLTNFTPDGVPGPRIDHVAGNFGESGDDFTLVPHADSSRYAAVGGVLELTIKNETSAHHPFHIHGFAYQPVAMLDVNGGILYEYPYREFVDNVDVHNGQQLVFRVPLDDRGMTCDDPVVPRACADAPSRGAVGRWLFHCHVFHHAALGMISELVVSAPEIEVDIAIKSLVSAAPIQADANGLIPVAILGSDGFDVRAVDVTTLGFGPELAAPAHVRGVHTKDVDGDGVTDLLSHFRTRESGIRAGDDEACLEGQTEGGVPFIGCGEIRTLP
jgi:FtsP/CotA-like multicopper oxidase with cupredoxin domain